MIHDDGQQETPDELHFFYDAQDRVTEIEYNGTRYGVIHNLQGDVVGLFDSNGTEVVQYAYNAWGKVLSVTGDEDLKETLGKIQPFRYRGYVYDEETGLYYLRSRYYKCKLFRLLCVDKYLSESSISKNSYTYCENKPIIEWDPDGSIAVATAVGIFVMVELISYHQTIISSVANEFLKERGWEVTNILFQHALTQGGYPFTDITKDPEMLSATNFVKSQIIADSQTHDMMQSHAEKIKPGSTKFIKSSFEYKKGDMYYAFQHVNYSATITKHKNGSWRAIVRLQDIYNFDSLRTPDSLGGVANDLGYILQGINSLNEFFIDLTFIIYSD